MDYLQVSTISELEVSNIDVIIHQEKDIIDDENNFELIIDIENNKIKNDINQIEESKSIASLQPPSGPVKWKLALLIFTCLYPTLISLDLILYYSGFYPNEDINGSIKLFCTAGLAVPTLVFILLPFAMGKLGLGSWVNTNGINDIYTLKRNVNIVICLISFILFFLIFTSLVWPYFRWKK